MSIDYSAEDTVHDLGIIREKRGNYVYPEPDVYRACCTCGWVAPIVHRDEYAVRSYARAEHPTRTHDMEVIESVPGGAGAVTFLRAACTCGDWSEDDWHPAHYRETRRAMASAHSQHEYAVRRAAVEAAS